MGLAGEVLAVTLALIVGLPLLGLLVWLNHTKNRNERP